MTFEEWWDESSVGKEPKYKDRKLSAGVAWKVGYYQAIVDCYGEAAAPLVLESLRKASNRPVEPFYSGGEGKGSQTAAKEHQAAQTLTHTYTIELPEGDTRTASVRFSECKADGSVMRHHLCVSVKPAQVAQPVAWQMPKTDSIITHATKLYRGYLADNYSIALYVAPVVQPPTAERLRKALVSDGTWVCAEDAVRAITERVRGLADELDRAAQTTSLDISVGM